MASLCRRVATVAQIFYRSFGRSVTVTSDNVTTSPIRYRRTCNIQRRFSSAKPVPQKKKVTLHFVIGGEKQSVQAKLGENLLDVIIENDVDIDGFGACEGTLACSTCHLIFKPDDYKKLPEEPSDEELDMLDLAYDLQDTSRLGCQVIVSSEMEGWEIRVPEGVADAREP